MNTSGDKVFAYTGVILAGGRSSRFGKDKSQQLWNGKRLFDYALDSMPECCTDKVAVIRREQDVSRFAGMRLAFDDLELPPCPLRGIIAGLESAKAKHALVMACDTPLVSSELWTLLMNIQSRESDMGSLLTISEWGGQLNPLLACYSVAAGQLLREQLISGQRSIFRAIKSIPHTVVTEAECNAVDPGGLSFLNVNTAEDLAKLELIS